MALETPTTRPRHVLLILLDGVGLPARTALADSVYRPAPTLRRLIESHGVAVGAGLGVPGTPQSATGQTAILTGVNAAVLLGEHLQGFPNAALRSVIERDNLFSQLLARGRTCTFANAYVRMPGSQLPLILRSVTTVAALAALGDTRNRDRLLAGQAVFHDLTRASLPEHGIPDVPLIDESQAADHLLGVLRSVDFCLFEYFLTDHAGHRGDDAWRARVLASLDRFLARLVEGLDVAAELLLLVSDHGNIEDGSRRGHTTNPVPWIAYGCGAEEARRGASSILDVTPTVLRLLAPAGRGPGAG